MTYEALVASVGEARYRAAREAAWKDVWPDDLDMVPHDLQDLWDDEQAPLGERLALALRVLAEMPCYANTMALKWNFTDLAPADRDTFWAFYREALDGDDERLVHTVSYSLWVDFFEDAATVEAAWAAMTESLTEPRTRRLLRAGGPGPWNLKEPFFGWLGQRWRDEIGDAIRRARAEVFGQVDERAARRFL